ncbi:Low-density receptor-like protein [Thalictrum thalictroides]|uniref:Low-density receptor-like protein n=1 Tax=Thalictrum thalictroides TaxID=46969 RepID=A0A7J6V160_THATH|nr:Low-density receptor-like protein [Thalictrum thalictroides]
MADSASASASPSKILFRVVLLLLIIFIAFYVGRPLYWKLSATIHEIHDNKQTVKQGISKFVLEAQKTVGWYFDESDSGFIEDQSAEKVGKST